MAYCRLHCYTIFNSKAKKKCLPYKCKHFVDTTKRKKDKEAKIKQRIDQYFDSRLEEKRAS